MCNKKIERWWIVDERKICVQAMFGWEMEEEKIAPSIKYDKNTDQNKER